MAYNDNELSQSNGTPRELYRFVGTYATYRYTSDTKARKWQAPDEDAEHFYFPIAMERDEITAGTPDDDNLEATIRLPANTELATVYAFNTSPPDLALTIWRFHTLDDVRPYWRGTITHIAIEDGIASLSSPSELGRAMQQDFPNFYYQSPCNHVLYDARCGVDYAEWSDELNVTAVNSKLITLAPIPANLNGQLVGGELVLPSGERRMIVSQAGNVVEVNFPFAALNVGTLATIAAGCNYAYDGDCKLKFDNQLRFGGFPFVAEDNIFETGVQPGNTLEDNTCLPPRFEGWIWRVGYRIYRNGRTNDDWTPGFAHMGGVAVREIRDRDNNLWTYLWSDGPNNPAPEPGEAGSFLFSFGFGSGSGTTCSKVFPNDPDNRCLAEVFVQHWSMQNPIVVAQGPHYAVGPISYQFVFPLIG